MIQVTEEFEAPRTRDWWLNRLVGTGAPLPESMLSWATLVKLGALLLVWRGAILLFSILIGHRHVITPWPAGIAGLWPWRYSVRWDAGWYLTIAQHGYQYSPHHTSSIAYFPLFPLAVRATHSILPVSFVLAGLIVVSLSLVHATLYILQLVRLDYDARIAWRTVVFLLLFPAAFFFSAVYSESLLLLWFAASLFHMRRGQWLLAAGFAALASATRPVGVALVVPLVLEILAQQLWHRDQARALTSLAIAPLGLIAYFAYLQERFGSFLVFFTNDARFSRHAFQPVFLLGFDWMLGDRSARIFYPSNTKSLASMFLLIDTSMVWIFLLAGVICWWKLRPSYGGLIIAGALIPALSGSPQSMTRYLVVLFPAFILLANTKSFVLRVVVGVVFAVGLGFTTWLFVNGLWAG